MQCTQDRRRKRLDPFSARRGCTISVELWLGIYSPHALTEPAMRSSETFDSLQFLQHSSMQNVKGCESLFLSSRTLKIQRKSHSSLIRSRPCHAVPFFRGLEPSKDYLPQPSHSVRWSARILHTSRSVCCSFMSIRAVSILFLNSDE